MTFLKQDLLRGASPQARVSAYYFVQAMSVGAVNAFAGIWLASKGISPGEVGVIFATPVAAILLIGIWVGRIADRADDWREVIVAGALASAVVPIGLYFAAGFWPILFLWTLAVTTQMMILPIVDAAAIRLCRRHGGDFSVLYVWKTIGYLLVIFASGLLLKHFGIQAFLPLFIGFSLLRGITSLILPNFKDPLEKNSEPASTTSFLRFLRPAFSLPLLGWSFVHSTHFVLNGFLGMLWHQQGLSPSTIGVLIGFSSVADTLMFFGFKRFTKGHSPQKMILISCLAGVLRFGAFGFSPGIETLFALQFLHGLTYALGFLACTNFIADNSTEEVAAEAQSFFSIIQAAAGALALVGFGWLAAEFGARAFLASAALAGIGSALVVISASFTESTSHAEPSKVE